MYHISNLGNFAGDPSNPQDPAYYTDANGFVPQEGDSILDFTGDTGDPEWEDFLDGAIAATARAEHDGLVVRAQVHATLACVSDQVYNSAGREK